MRTEKRAQRAGRGLTGVFGTPQFPWNLKMGRIASPSPTVRGALASVPSPEAMMAASLIARADRAAALAPVFGSTVACRTDCTVVGSRIDRRAKGRISSQIGEQTRKGVVGGAEGKGAGEDRDGVGGVRVKGRSPREAQHARDKRDPNSQHRLSSFISISSEKVPEQILGYNDVDPIKEVRLMRLPRVLQANRPSSPLSPALPFLSRAHTLQRLLSTLLEPASSRSANAQDHSLSDRRL